jgi:hypothetical protein
MRLTGLVFGAGALAAACLASRSALADVIDGEWCTVDNTLHIVIDGPHIVTPGGHAIQGDYSRHRFSYIVPADEPGGGQTVFMVLVNPETVNSRSGADAGSAANAPVLVWHHCHQAVSTISRPPGAG